MTKRISKIIKDELASKGIELFDIKLEFGRVGPEDIITLIDEISGGNMRAYKEGVPVEPLDLERLIVS